MTKREASCCCRQLKLEIEGEPIRVSICHCLECQRRTGSIFGVQARFLREQVKIIGNATRFERTGDEGNTARFGFCPTCGATVYWEFLGMPEYIAVAIGAFADPTMPPPKWEVYENRRHPWAVMPNLETTILH